MHASLFLASEIDGLLQSGWVHICPPFLVSSDRLVGCFPADHLYLPVSSHSIDFPVRRAIRNKTSALISLVPFS